ncbi:MAG TPA: tetratricopeptide repeat protein [Steroidobacteraceae bacterium]|nr:tetratricopeptide repeat protein [Steroidobacteraceae bacterium]
MVDDYLNDQEQWQRALAWLRESGPAMLGAVIVVLLGYGGWRYWQNRQTNIALAAEQRYEQMLSALDGGNLALGATLADRLIQEYPNTPYATQADLMAARIAVQNDQLPDAAKRLRHVLDTTRDPEMKLMVRLRLARVLLGQNQPDEALKLIDGVQTGAFASRYAEVRGDALLAKGDREGALQAYRSARAGADTLDSQLLDLKIEDLARS